MIRISLDGSEIVPLGQPIAGWSTPAFSMDGRAVFYTAMEAGRGNIWQFDLARGTHTRITSDSSTKFTPIWLPSRNGYLLNRVRGVANGTLEILNPSTGTMSEVIGEGLDHNVSPDGHYITFSTDVMGNIDLWYIDVRDPAMTRRPLLQTPQSERAASIAPNGQWFSYTLLTDGAMQVFLRRFPDARDPIQVSVDGGEQPFWHPSGQTLYFLTDSTLMEVDVAWEEPPKLSLPRTKFHSRNLDLDFIRSWDGRGNIAISPDGTFFVVGKRLTEESAGRVHIVEDWFEAFSRDE
jgi:Tol biopolymer transport system component